MATYEDVLEGFLNLSPEEQAKIVEAAQYLQSSDADEDDARLDEEIRGLLQNLGQHPKSGAEIVAAGLTGGWADKNITDSVAWLDALRHKRRDKFS